MSSCFCCLFTFFLFFCFNSPPVYEAYSTDIIKLFRSETLAPNGMKISSIGGSSDKGIKMIHIGVDTHGISNIEKGRRELVGLVEKLLKLYNENEKIRPYLLDYPFSSKNIQFQVSFLNEENNFFVKQSNVESKDQITYVSLHRGEVRYDIYTGEQISPLRTVFSESYEEALKIVKTEKTH